MALAARIPLGFAPRLLRKEEAARYMGVSPNYFDKLVKDGVLPKPKMVSESVKAWDRMDLDDHANHLPYLTDSSVSDETWDD